MRTKVLLSTLVLFSLLASCNMPAGQAPVTQPPENKPVSIDPNALATAVELTAIARVTEIAGSAVPATSTPAPTETATVTPTPTTAAVSGPCTPAVTANVVANVRSGPDTAYDIVGSLSQGQTANIVGRNDAYTWWYIDYQGVAGNHAWVSGSVVTSACVPAVVQVVAAPALPASTATNVGDILVLDPPLQLVLLSPDLVVTSMSVPDKILITKTAIVTLKVKNKGTAAAGGFTVQWWAGSALGCSWPVSSLAAGASKTLSCSYNFPNAGDYTVKTVVDSGATVSESSETNNTSHATVKVTKFVFIPLIIVTPP